MHDNLLNSGTISRYFHVGSTCKTIPPMSHNEVNHAEIRMFGMGPIFSVLGDFPTGSNRSFNCKCLLKGFSVSLYHFHLSKVIFERVLYAHNLTTNHVQSFHDDLSYCCPNVKILQGRERVLGFSGDRRFTPFQVSRNSTLPKQHFQLILHRIIWQPIIQRNFQNALFFSMASYTCKFPGPRITQSKP